MQKMQNGKWVMNDKLGEQNTFSEVFFCEFFSGASWKSITIYMYPPTQKKNTGVFGWIEILNVKLKFKNAKTDEFILFIIIMSWKSNQVYFPVNGKSVFSK